MTAIHFSLMNALSAGRRAEETANMLGMTLYMSGQLRTAHRVYDAAREQCMVRQDTQMLGQLTVGVCIGLLHFNQHRDALILLHQLVQLLPENQQYTITAANGHAALAVCLLREGLIGEAQQCASTALGVLKQKGKKTQPSAFWAFANAIGVVSSRVT